MRTTCWTIRRAVGKTIDKKQDGRTCGRTTSGKRKTGGVRWEEGSNQGGGEEEWRVQARREIGSTDGGEIEWREEGWRYEGE